MKKLSTMGLALALLMALGGAAQADEALLVDGGWQPFDWGLAPDGWNDEGAFTYDAVCWTSLKVTDAYLDGDQFEVYDLGELIGTTSIPVNDGAAIGIDFDAAYADSRWSSGEFLLAPGSHAVTLKAILNPYGYGTGGLRADCTCAPTVPAPAGILLGMLGTGLVGWLRRRRAL